MNEFCPRRRTLIRALGALGVLGGWNALMPPAAFAAAGSRSATPGHIGRLQKGPPRNVTFDAHVRTDRFHVAGRGGAAYSVNDSVPSPLIELWEGQTARLRVHNHLDVPTSLHWHGLLLPFTMDGVPGVSFPGVSPGETFEAYFPVRQSGTYWYHSHSGVQEQKGLTGPLVVHSAEPDPHPVACDFVVMLNDWTFDDPHRIMTKLKAQSDYYNLDERTVGDFFEEVEAKGWSATLQERRMWGDMRMSPRDIADISGLTYDYLLNGHHSATPWEGLFAPGERVRLRFINASAMTYFNVRIPGLAMTVVAADGQPVEPVEIDEFQIGVAETFDVIVAPEARPYTLMCESMDRTGFALGSLTPSLGEFAPVPSLRKPPRRTMADMSMGAMAGMDTGSMARMSGTQGADMTMGASDMGQMHDGGMVDHRVPHGAWDAGIGMKEGAMDDDAMQGGSMAAPMGHQSHGERSQGMMHAAMRDRLDEPGLGLENVDHRVLRYTQLRRPVAIEDQRSPTRTVTLHLTGNMERYMWSFDGKAYSESGPIDFHYGERLRLVLINNTMMEHPIHLHGMFMALENGQGAHLPLKHTISVRPAARVSLLVTADEPGRWAFHCHLLYHMEMGMFRVVRVLDKEHAHE